MVFRLGQWSHSVFALALASSVAAVVYDPALGQASPEPSTSIVSQYVPLLYNHLTKHTRYPDRDSAGRVDLRFSIDRQGRVLDVRVVRSSRSDALDREALDLIRRASPVPAPPSQLVRVIFTLPIQFHSRRPPTLSSSVCRLCD
jgi:protein TonB